MFINVKMPEKGYFKIDIDRKIKQMKISPGLYIEILIIFECYELGNYIDQVEISSENNLSMMYKMKALVNKEAVIFEPISNFGLVSVNTVRIEHLNFVNEGSLDCEIELRPEKQLHPDFEIFPLKFHLNKKINEKELSELYYMQNKDEKERQKLRELIEAKKKARKKVKLIF